MTSNSLVVPSMPKMNSSKGRVNKLMKVDRLFVLSTYTKTILTFVAIQIFITYCVLIMASEMINILSKNGFFRVQLTVAVLSVLIAFLIALLIALVKKISESYPLNVVLVVFYVELYVDIGAEILFFFITIFISHLTVGKSRYFLFYPNYAFASIFLYTVFFAYLPVNIDMFGYIANASSINCTKSI
ncbi:unnamed protein product [Schistosoma turkestanicum]|nr:unnamed protein product [Schistosoma turkestanicum]